MSTHAIFDFILAGDVDGIRCQIDEYPGLVYVRHSSEDVCQGQQWQDRPGSRCEAESS